MRRLLIAIVVLLAPAATLRAQPGYEGGGGLMAAQSFVFYPRASVLNSDANAFGAGISGGAMPAEWYDAFGESDGVNGSPATAEVFAATAETGATPDTIDFTSDEGGGEQMAQNTQALFCRFALPPFRVAGSALENVSELRIGSFLTVTLDATEDEDPDNLVLMLSARLIRGGAALGPDKPYANVEPPVPTGQLGQTDGTPTKASHSTWSYYEWWSDNSFELATTSDPRTIVIPISTTVALEAGDQILVEVKLRKNTGTPAVVAASLAVEGASTNTSITLTLAAYTADAGNPVDAVLKPSHDLADSAVAIVVSGAGDRQNLAPTGNHGDFLSSFAVNDPTGSDITYENGLMEFDPSDTDAEGYGVPLLDPEHTGQEFAAATIVWCGKLREVARSSTMPTDSFALVGSGRLAINPNTSQIWLGVEPRESNLATVRLMLIDDAGNQCQALVTDVPLDVELCIVARWDDSNTGELWINGMQGIYPKLGDDDVIAPTVPAGENIYWCSTSLSDAQELGAYDVRHGRMAGRRLYWFNDRITDEQLAAMFAAPASLLASVAVSPFRQISVYDIDMRIPLDPRRYYVIRHAMSNAVPVYLNMAAGAVEADDATAADKMILHDDALGHAGVLVSGLTEFTATAAEATDIVVQEISAREAAAWAMGI